MDCVELFAGMGGIRYGLEKANKKFKFVWANEIDKFACEIYRKNYGGDELHEGNIKTIRYSRIPKFGMLVAGFPCQSFSLAGNRKGFEDTRGTMFYEIAKLVKKRKPEILLLENVRGLLSHDNGSTFETILRILGELGYIVQWEVLNSQNFGLPQNRERLFIIGHLGKRCFKQIFPIGQNGKKDIGTTEGIRIHSLQPRTGDPRKGGTGPLSRNDGKTYCIDTKNTQVIEVGNKVRKLTPIERERLQGFPDNWSRGVSEIQRSKLLGNAVTTNVIKAIGEKII